MIFFFFLSNHLYQSFLTTSKALEKTLFFSLQHHITLHLLTWQTTRFTLKPYIYIHSFLRQSDLKLFLQQAFYCLALGFSHQLLLKRWGKLHREMSILGNSLVATSPEHLSTLQASKHLSLQHPSDKEKCCNAICEVGG